MVSNSVEFLKAIKKEEGDPVGSRASSNFGKRCSMDPEPSISRIDDVRLKHPTKYIIRKAVTPSTAPPLKRIFIGRNMSPGNEERFSCPLCGKAMLRRNLYDHLRKIHDSSEQVVESMKANIKIEANAKKDEFHIICPVCDDQFLDQEELAIHCNEEHTHDGANGEEQDYTVHDLDFASKKDFEMWLNETCEKTVTSLYKNAKSGNTIYYRCNRSGKFVSKSKYRVCCSRKVVLHCSCYVNAHFNSDGTVGVKACFGHVGHELEPALLHLSDSQRQYLKSMLEEHSLDYVIRRCRKDFSAKDSRMYFMTKNDLWNIINKHGLKPGYRDADDLKSIQLREAEHNEDDGIRLLEMPTDPSGKGFAMVIITPLQLHWLRAYSSRGISIDDTHGATRYTLKLATVVVADERDRGLPAAFLLSGTMGTVDVEKLFKEIKKLMPDFNPARIVTDEAMCFYSGFRSTFPQSTAKLHYCRWHISKSWEKKVRELVEPQHRAQVNMELKQLLLVGQLTDFQQRFAHVLAFLDVERHQRMAQYLRTNYLSRVKSWASFHVEGAVMDTTMLSERWHLRLKNEILHRNANSRIDCLVELLIRAVEDLADSNEIKDRRRLAQASFRTQQTSIRHRSAQAQYQGKSEKITSIGIRKWEVEGRKPDAKFIVEDKGGCICPPNFGKNVHCPSCNVCPYSWTCSCLDNRAGISCVHRHAVKMFEDQNAPCGEEHSPAVMEEHEEIALRSTSSSVVSEVQSRMDMRKSIRNNIEMRYSVVSTNVNRLVNSDTQEACAKLLDIQNLIDQASKITLLSSSLEPRIAVRPELSKPGMKPLLKKVSLYTRAECRRQRNADKNNNEE